jgi:hypothetical protein
MATKEKEPMRDYEFYVEGWSGRDNLTIFPADSEEAVAEHAAEDFEVASASYGHDKIIVWVRVPGDVGFRRYIVECRNSRFYFAVHASPPRYPEIGFAGEPTDGTPFFSDTRCEKCHLHGAFDFHGEYLCGACNDRRDQPHEIVAGGDEGQRTNDPA